MEPSEHKISISGHQEISYYQAGDQGSPVLLLHGGGVDSALLSWREAIPAFSKNHRVFAPNWPGYGNSPWVPGRYSIEMLVNVVGQLMDALEIERANVVGLSMGGAAALGFSLAQPERVRNLVLVDSYGLAQYAPAHFLSYLFVQVPAFTHWTYAWLRKSRGLTRWSVQRIFGDPAHLSEDIVDEVFEVIQNPAMGSSFYAFQVDEVMPKQLKTYYGDLLDRVKARTLIIHGEKDYLVPVRDARRAAESIPGARLEILPGCGHWPPRECPQAFNRLVLDFIHE